MNWGHRNILCWSFHAKRKEEEDGLGQRPFNINFHRLNDENKIRRKFESVTANASLKTIVSCRYSTVSYMPA